MAGTQAEIDALLAEAEAQAQQDQSQQAAAERATVRAAERAVEETSADKAPATMLSDGSPVPAPVRRILHLRVPLMVVLAERKMPVREILHMCIGSIIEFEKPFDEELELLVNNRSIAFGQAVKVGENFGLRVTRVADVKARIDALRPDPSKPA